MNDKITALEDIKNILSAKKDLDNHEVDINDLPLEELEGVEDLYLREIKSIKESIKEVAKENEYLRKLIKENNNE